MRKINTLVLPVLLAGCGMMAKKSGDGYVVVRGANGETDTVYYDVIDEPKGNADDTIWHWHQKTFHFRLSEGQTQQTVDLNWSLHHLGVETSSAQLNVDSSGLVFQTGNTMISNIRNSSSAGTFILDDGSTITYQDSPEAGIFIEEDGSRTTVDSHVMQITASDVVRLDVDPDKKFVVLRRIPSRMTNTHGLIFDKKMMVENH
ncbi:MAG TPA: hypothetical protein VL651_04015 [Bacteroidia bacterium]|jgi:hypothetical protein|nr:hypothetical protein [Bacteroidia bacterium]